ncbi:hypothetical protein AMAG_05818 [Allomyces macrogynus ATCC 38327]|uniref:Uncharacterized protein n=1 Tax=Allomyces macrogynus (strain ATCC 38327) TaxID=578462 RepID=A0A0L0SDE7_ALLM3|nr:hypothetical protein AMAG_05818 [Allomyces macrogynus ATCC 38327]|eukprot:KNE60430.1 hypothetical protein AMAG_05818 [Allomyces macrogynus ATCC 38327]
MAFPKPITDSESGFDDFAVLRDIINDVLPMRVQVCREMPKDAQLAMAHYLAQSLLLHSPADVEKAIKTVAEGDNGLLLDLIEEQMVHEEFQPHDRIDAFRFALHALQMVEDEGNGDAAADSESDSESDSGSESDGDGLPKLRPGVRVLDEGGHVEWFAEICCPEYYSSIRALDSADTCRFLTRSSQWPIVFDLTSSANHYQCANSLALGAPIVRLDHLVLQQPITMDHDAILSHLDPTWFKRRPSHGHTQMSLASTKARPLSLAAAHGYLLVGDDEGNLAFFCYQPLEILATATASDASIQSTNGKEQMAKPCKLAAYYQDGACYSTQIVDGMHGGYFAVVTQYSGVVEVYELPRHTDPGANGAAHRAGVYSMQKIWLRACVNDAKISPDHRLLVAVGDQGNVWIARVEWDALDMVNNPVLIALEHPVLFAVALADSGQAVGPAEAVRTMLADFTSQQLAWAPCATRFAVSSDTHPYLLVFSAPALDGERATLEHVVFTAQPTYAVAFHPHDRSILAASNRHGFVQIIDIDACDQPHVEVSEGKAVEEAAAMWSADAIMELAAAARQYPREVVPVRVSSTSCQINGLQWSLDGQLLYIATCKRVLVHQFNRPSSLFELVAQKLHVSDADVMADACQQRFMAATVGIEAKFRH